MLRAEDWCGDLLQSIEGGLYRWYLTEMQAGGLRHVDLDLLFTDDITETVDENTGYDLHGYPGHWIKEHGRGRPEGGQQVGCVGLGCGDGYTTANWGAEVFLGERLRQLNAVVPGAGYSVYALVCDAFSLVNGITPDWGRSWLEFSGDYRLLDDEELEEEPERGYYFGRPDFSEDQRQRARERVMRRYRRGFPRGVWSMKWRPELVRRALRKVAAGCQDPHDGNLSGTPPEVLLEPLERALSLAELAQPESALNQAGLFDFHGEELAVPVILHWDRRGLLGRLHDDYMESANECAGWTSVVFRRGWQADYPESIRECLRGLKLAVEILVRADRLLQVLHLDPAREEERVRCRA